MNYQLSFFYAIRHKITVYHTVRHKSAQNIPKIWSVLQLYLLLQRQNDKLELQNLIDESYEKVKF